MLAQIALECALMPPASAADALDLALLSRWIDPLGADGLADLFFEWRSEVAFDLRDGAVAVPEVVIESGVAARARCGPRHAIPRRRRPCLPPRRRLRRKRRFSHARRPGSSRALSTAGRIARGS